MQVPSLGQEDSLEKEMTTWSRTLPWKIPWTEETRGLQSMGSQKSRTGLSTHTFLLRRHRLRPGQTWWGMRKEIYSASGHASPH